MRTITLTALFVAVGCATTGNDQLVDDSPAGKADGASYPSGRYTNPSPSVGELSTLTLETTLTAQPYQPFERAEVVECAQGILDCPPLAQSGVYKFTRSRTKRFIQFYSAPGSADELDRYQWRTENGHLELNYDGADHWFEMDIADSVKHCGGWLGETCGADEFCDYTPDSCGTADQSGTCMPRPQACPEILAPVVGCDGKTYDNSCRANQNGVDVGGTTLPT